MKYIVGDVQGCCDALDRLLAEVAFSPSRDSLVMLGDLVNRGPRSLATLERLRELGGAARCLLGNHDFHLLAVACGVRQTRSKKDTLDEILESPAREPWIAWLREQHLALHDEGWLMVHAGVVPQWDLATTLRLAGEVEARLRTGDLRDFLRVVSGDAPVRWDDVRSDDDRLRFAVTVLTRIRFVDAEGVLELATKEGPEAAPTGYMPWFEAPKRKTEHVPIAFGHWAYLGLVDRPDLLALDTGCVYGGRLSAVRVDGGRREIIQVPCAKATRTA